MNYSALPFQTIKEFNEHKVLLEWILKHNPDDMDVKYELMLMRNLDDKPAMCLVVGQRTVD